jgi:signal transduction histidine kinase
VWLREARERTYRLVAGSLRAPNWRRRVAHRVTPELLAEISSANAIRVLPGNQLGDQLVVGDGGTADLTERWPQHIMLTPVQLPAQSSAVFCFIGYARTLARDHELLRAMKLELEIILRNAESHRAAAARALIAEREGIGMELHDGLAQSLFSIQLQLGEVRSLVPETAEHAQARLDSITLEVAQAAHELRSALSGLRYALPENRSLDVMIRRYVEQFTKKHAIKATFRHTGRRWQPFADVEVQLFRVVQELLTNVRKHADASTVQVLLHVGTRQLRLTVTDDGKGFNATSQATTDGSEHFGLAGIRHRVQRFGGQLTIRSAPGGGTEAMVTIPLGWVPERSAE